MRKPSCTVTTQYSKFRWEYLQQTEELKITKTQQIGISESFDTNHDPRRKWLSLASGRVCHKSVKVDKNNTIHLSATTGACAS